MGRDERAPWSTIAVLRRLGAIVRAVPKAGGGTQSRSFSGVAGYARDAEALQVVVATVLYGVTINRPHPQFGDDGGQDDARSGALRALKWAEAWVAWRNRHDWSSENTVSWEDRPWADDAGEDE